MLKKKLLIFGAGGYGHSVAEAVLINSLLNTEVLGFVDDSYSECKQVWDLPVVGDTKDLFRYHRLGADKVIVAIGNNTVRAELQARLIDNGFELETVIHPQAIVSPSAVIGVGCTIMAGAIVGTESRLGEGVIVNAGAVVDHHCQVGDFGHLGVGTTMAGGARLGVGAWLHTGNSLGYGTAIGDWVVVK
ncbi:acetyltransferase [Cellvibrio sp. PSBB006]|uniref:PglD-related sugar-binding protein n=1 Tax=Cellvibrio sp. PSBB006 TaxID=1987723 RepID=UPI000B3B432B|nr:acetyltransferase [Cellvibrio sp. PSBB006]ARU26799.1 acetyltransferase [Cellvibrio sp. PSBB006]